MKLLILLYAAFIVCVGLNVEAAPFHRKPVAKPVAPAVAPAAVETAVGPLPESEPQPFTVNPDGSVTRSKQADAELKDWLVGLQTENRLNGDRADKAESSERVVRGVLAEAITKANALQTEVQTVTDDRNAQAKLKDKANDDRDEAISARDVEHKARVAADAHVSSIKTKLTVVLAVALILALNMALSGPLMSAIPYVWYIRIGGSVACYGLAWLIVARAV